MDKPGVYIETSIVSYLAARPSRDPVTAANQRLTHEWWTTRRHDYALYTSKLVWEEAARGDPPTAQRRLALLASMPVLAPRPEALLLGQALRLRTPLPRHARSDAVHIALAATHGMAYVLTWDSRHIANPQLRVRMDRVCADWGYTMPNLCTPVYLLGE